MVDLNRHTSGSLADTLGIADDELSSLMDALNQGATIAAQRLMGIDTGNTFDIDNPDTSKYNPVTGLPWASGPITQPPKDTRLREYLKSFKRNIENAGGIQVLYYIPGDSEATNILQIEYRMSDNNDVEEFEEEYINNHYFVISDEIMGRITISGGGIGNTGPSIGMYLEGANIPKDQTLFDYVKDIFEVEE